ncbi:PilZ domain-containing protein [Alteromonas gilva]|uniref:PilZ domain-containing protein n=1 Tax=Alteromonas gilva TaxID=2987522 RepID=A0ABT5L9M6_9ALTE|nr:PilZ domain-containing protein [Alteromonas gilva]MDC8832763.1 PilZ domain-containing protein [Alteromonas gilva]
MSQEKRQFQRIAINLPGDLVIAGETVTTQVQDLSLQGMRVRLPATTSSQNQPVTLTFKANAESPVITVRGSITNITPLADDTDFAIAGIQLTHISVEDMSQLRRLLQLNSGQQDLDSLELSALLEQIWKALN